VRATILVGIILVAFGATILYQTRNGFFMYAVGWTMYGPPADEQALAAAFEELSEAESMTAGVTLGAVASARVDCATSLLGYAPNDAARTAFHRLNLMMLGAGMNVQSNVIDPNAYRVTELRRDLTRNAVEWQDEALTTQQRDRLREVFAEMIYAESRSFTDLGLQNNHGALELSRMAEIAVDGGKTYFDCVNDRRF